MENTNTEAEDKSTRSRNRKPNTTEQTAGSGHEKKGMASTNKSSSSSSQKGGNGGRGGGNKKQSQTRGGVQTSQQQPGSAKSSGQRPAHNNKNNNNNNRASGGRQQRQQQQQSPFTEHMSPDLVRQGLIDGYLFAGKLKVFPNKRKLGYVEVHGLTLDVLIEDERLRNRALVGDTVTVQLLPEDKWKHLGSGGGGGGEGEGVEVAEVSVSLADMEVSSRSTGLWRPREDLLRAYHTHQDQDQGQGQDERADEDEDGVKEKEGGENERERERERACQGINDAARITRTQPTGRVVGILSPAPKGHTSIAGALTLKTPSPSGGPLADSVAYCTFKPANAAYPHFIVPRIQLPDAFRDNPNALLNHIYLLDAAPLWPTSSTFPYGQNVRSVGEVGSIQAETTALLVEHDLNHSIFSDEILNSLNDMLRESSATSTSSSSSSSDSGKKSQTSQPQSQSQTQTQQQTGGGGGGQENWVIPEEEIARRLDLRSTRIFTIDPPGAKDLDDALHITPLPADSPPCCAYEVGVHIADVSYFVREGTPLDTEAQHRATSVYLVQRVIPMLPPLLCEQLCSLNPNVDRLAFSCIFRMTDDGCLCPKHETFYGKTVIRSCAKLDYGTAQRMVDGAVPITPHSSSNEDAHIDQLSEEVWEARRRPPLGCGQKAWEIARDVQLLHKVAMPRRAQRLAFGALQLNNPKLTFRLDSEGNPCGMSTYEIKESNQLIEEYMLLANYLVAEKLVETVGRCGFLRMHPPPDSSGLENLVALGSKIGHHVDITSAQTLQQSLKDIAITASPVVTQAITALMMLPMNCAEYFVIDKLPSQAWKHYALAIPYYTHFTSPIRRYADVMVHRFLEEGLKLEQQQQHAHPKAKGQQNSAHPDNEEGVRQLSRRYPFKKLHAIAEQCNMRKASAHAAQIRSDEVYLGVYLMRNPALYTQSEAVVIGMGEKFFSVLLLEFSLQMRIFLDKSECLSQEASSYSADTQVLSLRHKETGKELQVTYMTRVLVRVYASASPPPITVNVALSPATFDL